ncbi:hypothetical protein [Methylobacterium oryzae]|uniref:hypothetical protein n=1 Tax=Methylobacterium oryzae TaxID=334852 RepID=UPI001F2A6A09|nr:hypothetical protein [Methylobacterium oryzae]UIN38304.1 hypothetical protein LXM90_31205 [Methylobacterium oryzae]
MRRIIDSFRYTGQPSLAWPAWLVFRNYARSSDGGLLIIHGFDSELRVLPGQTLALTATQEIALLAE